MYVIFRGDSHVGEKNSVTNKSSGRKAESFGRCRMSLRIYAISGVFLSQAALFYCVMSFLY